MSPPALDPALLDRLPPELRDAVEAEIAARAAAIEVEREARLRAERDRADMAERVACLEHLIAELRRARFGRSSEKLSADQLEMAFEGEPVKAPLVQAHWRARRRSSRRRPRPARRPRPRRRRRARPSPTAAPARCPRACRAKSA